MTEHEAVALPELPQHSQGPSLPAPSLEQSQGSSSVPHPSTVHDNTFTQTPDPVGAYQQPDPSAPHPHAQPQHPKARPQDGRAGFNQSPRETWRPTPQPAKSTPVNGSAHPAGDHDAESQVPVAASNVVDGDGLDKAVSEAEQKPSSGPSLSQSPRPQEPSLDSLAKLRQFKREVEASRQTKSSSADLDPARLAKIAESFLLSQNQPPPQQKSGQTPLSQSSSASSFIPFAQNGSATATDEKEKAVREQQLKEQLRARVDRAGVVEKPKDQSPSTNQQHPPGRRPRAEDLIDPGAGSPAAATPIPTGPAALSSDLAAPIPSFVPPSHDTRLRRPPPEGPALSHPLPPQPNINAPAALHHRPAPVATPAPGINYEPSEKNFVPARFRDGKGGKPELGAFRKAGSDNNSPVYPRVGSVPPPVRDERHGPRDFELPPPPRSDGRSLADRISAPRSAVAPPRPRSPSPVRGPAPYRPPRNRYIEPPAARDARDSREYRRPPSPRRYADRSMSPPPSALSSRLGDPRNYPDPRDPRDPRNAPERFRERDYVRPPPLREFDRPLSPGRGRESIRYPDYARPPPEHRPAPAVAAVNENVLETIESLKAQISHLQQAALQAPPPSYLPGDRERERERYARYNSPSDRDYSLPSRGYSPPPARGPYRDSSPPYRRGISPPPRPIRRSPSPPPARRLRRNQSPPPFRRGISPPPIAPLGRPGSPPPPSRGGYLPAREYGYDRIEPVEKRRRLSMGSDDMRGGSVRYW
ncbi:hypothetical protein IAR50_004631 [Cryptococcus sp. DSM 104548]